MMPGISKMHQFASVSKRVLLENFSYENVFDLHENERACETHFHMKGFDHMATSAAFSTRSVSITN